MAFMHYFVPGVMICLSAGCVTEPPIRVATDATFPPFHYVDDNDEVTAVLCQNE